MTPEEFRTLHNELGISTSDLARALGVERRTVQRWKAGEVSPPAYIQLAMERLSQILDGEADVTSS